MMLWAVLQHENCDVRTHKSDHLLKLFQHLCPLKLGWNPNSLLEPKRHESGYCLLFQLHLSPLCSFSLCFNYTSQVSVLQLRGLSMSGPLHLLCCLLEASPQAFPVGRLHFTSPLRYCLKAVFPGPRSSSRSEILISRVLLILTSVTFLHLVCISSKRARQHLSQFTIRYSLSTQHVYG